MDDALIDRIIDYFETNPASPEDWREIIRRLITHLRNFDTLESEIMAWDADGRDPAKFERIRKRAWNFEGVSEPAYRRRIFAGFVTNASDSDGYAADFLIDCAKACGISNADILSAMIPDATD